MSTFPSSDGNIDHAKATKLAPKKQNLKNVKINENRLGSLQTPQAQEIATSTVLIIKHFNSPNFPPP